MKIHSIIHIFIVWLCIIHPSFAQDKDSVYNYSSSTPILPNLPELSALIDSAMVHSPILKSQDASITIQQLKLRNSRKQWTEYINLSADYQYGSYDNIVANQFSSGINNMLTSSSTQSRYGVGINIKYPIFNLFSRGNNISMARHDLEISKLKKEELESELRKSIIILYNDIILARSLVDIKSKLKETSQLQVDFAELEYRTQKINIYDLAKVADAHAKNLADYEKAMYDLRVSIELMSELTGINIQNQQE